MHLSHLPQSVLFGFFWQNRFCGDRSDRITSDGRVYLTTSIGASPTFLQTADKVIIEINRRQSPRISEMADIIIPGAASLFGCRWIWIIRSNESANLCTRGSSPCGRHSRNR